MFWVKYFKDNYINNNINLLKNLNFMHKLNII